jgi:2-oxo-3-hexenedioate decarboxylase
MPLSNSYPKARAAQTLALLGTGRQIAPFSSQHPDFTLTQAYDIAARIQNLRQARGETPVGRKIGFTNTTVWHGLGLEGPIWNYMFDTTVADISALGETFKLPNWPEPRIEPEIVLHLATAPAPGMSDAELLACVDWIAPAFELVTSIFPNWTFTAADATAAFGVHGALLLGQKLMVPDDRIAFARTLTSFTVDLAGPGELRTQGHARNVLGGPIQSLAFLVAEIARFGSRDPLRAGELITTGTLTDAMPIKPSQTWTAHFTGIGLASPKLSLAPSGP